MMNPVSLSQTNPEEARETQETSFQPPLFLRIGLAFFLLLGSFIMLESLTRWFR